MLPGGKRTEKFRSENNSGNTKKDTAYDKFRQELDGLRKAAKGNFTNSSAVKSLFARNKVILAKAAGLANANTGAHAD